MFLLSQRRLSIYLSIYLPILINKEQIAQNEVQKCSMLLYYYC